MYKMERVDFAFLSIIVIDYISLARAISIPLPNETMKINSSVVQLLIVCAKVVELAFSLST
ncbi:hypothetical protein T07_88 [Trichinella nelsoni]|uniref:Uncharacterized protein n=1 Tax=Trichinella nelsoni TaxID=6336 RepID=A0A0V0RJK5_9BILA|nr:hypothetical protein T07_88 [Trichinella nelsoni]